MIFALCVILWINYYLVENSAVHLLAIKYQHIFLFCFSFLPNFLVLRKAAAAQKATLNPDTFIVYICSLACHCYSLGTALGNSTLCDQVTGQCMCNATANIGGRRCDMCRENSWNNSVGLCEGKHIHSL